MKIVIEQVEIPDLLIPRKLFSPNNPDIFDIPDSLYERWEKANADFWSVQTELNLQGGAK